MRRIERAGQLSRSPFSPKTLIIGAVSSSNVAVEVSRVPASAMLVLEGLDIEWDPDEEATQVPGARLFLDTARRVRPGLSLGPEDRESLEEILGLTQGMPLAILMAASWADMLPVPEIAAEISKSLDFLSSKTADAPDRHQSIRAVFDYTWAQLQPREQEVFATLSVFRGGFTREAADFIAGASLRDLADLAGKSLITPNPNTGRYSVHELLRQYAAAALATWPDREEDALNRHAEYYSDLVEECFDFFPRGRELEMMDGIESDLDNIRSSWRYHVVTGNVAGLSKMIGGIWIVYEIRGWYQAVLPLVEEALGRLSHDDERSKRVRALLAAIHGATVALLGRPDLGEVEVDEAVAVIRDVGSAADFWFVMQMKTQTMVYVGDMAAVRQAAEEAIADCIMPRSDWEHQSYWCAGTMVIGGFAAFLTGDIPRAIELLDKSSAVFEPLDDLYWMTWNLGHRARLATAAGDIDEAIELFRQSADRARRLGFLRGLQVSLASLASLLISKGEVGAAEEVVVESLATAERISMVPQMLGAAVQMAKVYAATGREHEAVQLLASVAEEPAADTQLFTEPEPIRTQVESRLEALAAELTPTDFEQAKAEGSTTSFRFVVKTILS